MPRAQFRLGEILVKEGLISEAQLQETLTVQSKDAQRRPIGEVLVSMGFISEESLALALSKQMNIPYVSVQPDVLKTAKDMKIQKLIPEDFARKHRVLPYNKSASVINIIFSDPLDVMAMDNIKLMTRLEVVPAIATLSDIKKGLDELYGKEDSYKKAVAETEAASQASDELGSAQGSETGVSTDDAPVVKLADFIIKEAINNQASDIHIEPFETRIAVRYRIDGILYEMPPPAKHFFLPLISRIKILSKMDIAEKRLPQDGGFMIQSGDKTVDLRISTMPTIYGEKIVIRILDKTKMVVGLKQLGFESESLEKFKKAILKPYGLIFITGPTGSGKTTTLYGTLSELSTPKKNVVTIEDPVEYKLEGVNQVQVKSQIGLTFAAALRTFLRQDPDIVMVGEVRDLETAEMCVRASLAGRLVLSTLHTNDAASSISRLTDFGLEPFLVGSSLIMVEAQRLVRKLCPHCHEAYEPDTQIQKKYNIKGTIYKAAGCEKCRHIGYTGRVGIYEVLLVTENIRELIFKKASSGEIKDLGVKEGMKTLLDSGIEKVKQGLTSLEEVLSIVFSD